MKRPHLRLVPTPARELTRHQIEMFTCVRCCTLDPELVALRALWNTSGGVPLCEDCNGLVQGPDFIDITTGNRV